MDSNQCPYSFSLNNAVDKWRTLTDNDGILLENEFNSLRPMNVNRIRVATDPINIHKNRFESIFAYDEDFCRVTLQNPMNGNEIDDDSDYINASIVRHMPPESVAKTYSSRVFFAAQGPIEQTIDDFIQMIIEQNIDTIVMLSFNYKPHAHRYAEEHAAYFSENVNTAVETKLYRINTTDVIHAYQHIIRHLTIQSKTTDLVYHCQQYHYPHFVDKSVPADCYSMISFVMKLLEPNHQDSRILVHCSAGVGRTGVFIALYYLLEAAKNDHLLNVKKLVDTLRIYRAHLVCTLEQYEFLYRCLAEISIHPYFEWPLDQFISYWNSSLTTARLKTSKIYREFHNRCISVLPNSYFTSTITQRYSNYNRNPSFIPYDYDRVMLNYPSESLYINATKIANIMTSTGTILTQEPMQSTVQPFYCMLLQECKKIIVAVEQLNETSYIGSDFNRNKIQMTVESSNLSNDEFRSFYRSHKMQVKYSNLEQCNTFVFEYTGEWTTNDTFLPKNLEEFVCFIDQSIYNQQKLDPDRLGLVVHDRDGGTKAAFYCIAQNLIDRLLLDGCVAIENFVTIVCQHRKHALISLEQYIALHEIVCIWNNLNRRGTLKCHVNNRKNK